MPRSARVHMYWDAMVNSDLHQHNKFFELRAEYQQQAIIAEPDIQERTHTTAVEVIRGIFEHPDIPLLTIERLFPEPGAQVALP